MNPLLAVVATGLLTSALAATPPMDTLGPLKVGESEVIRLESPHPYPAGDGEFVFLEGCGSCLSRTPVSVENRTWGRVKEAYRD